jgi:hypothetical protein
MKKVLVCSVFMICFCACSQGKKTELDLENIKMDFNVKNYIDTENAKTHYNIDSQYVTDKDGENKELLGKTYAYHLKSKFKSIVYNEINFLLDVNGEFIAVCAGSKISDLKMITNTVNELKTKFGNPTLLNGTPYGEMENKLWITNDRIIQTSSYFDSNYSSNDLSLSNDDKNQTFIYIINKKYIDKFKYPRKSLMSGSWIHYTFISNPIVKIELVDSRKNNTIEFDDNITKQKSVETINGDFNGDGKIEFAYVSLKDGFVYFSNKDIPPVPHSSNTGEFRLFNEGDLDNDGINEISVYQSYDIDFDQMTTYSIKNGYWNQIISPFLVFNNSKKISNEEIEDKVFIENKKAYYYDFENIEKVMIQHSEDKAIHNSNRNYKLIKKEIKY